MTEHGKKMIAPIVVTILAIVYYVVYFGVMIAVVEGIWKILLGIIPIVLAITTIYVCYERIEEIRSGEEDDLSEY